MKSDDPVPLSQHCRSVIRNHILSCREEEERKERNQASGTCAIDLEMWASWHCVVALFLKCSTVRNQYAKSNFGKLAQESLGISESYCCIHPSSVEVPWPHLVLCKISSQGTLSFLPVTEKIKLFRPLWTDPRALNHCSSSQVKLRIEDWLHLTWNY